MSRGVLLCQWGFRICRKTSSNIFHDQTMSFFKMKLWLILKLSLTRPWQTYQFSFFKPYISITPLNYWQSTDNSIKWWASSSMEKFGIPQKLQTSKCQKKIFFLKKKPNSQLFLRFLAILVTLKLPWCSIKTKNSSSYSIKIKSVWLWFPTSPWMNLWMIFLNSLINSSRELYNSFCGHETFKKSPSQGRV